MVRAALQFHVEWNCTRSSFSSYCRHLTDYMVYLLQPAIDNGSLSIFPTNKRSAHILGVWVNTRPTGCGDTNSNSNSNSNSNTTGVYCNHTASEIGSHLKHKCRVHIAVRYGFLRISPYIYNTSMDVEKLCEHLLALLLI